MTNTPNNTNNSPGDQTLNNLRLKRLIAEDAVLDFYDAIREAKANGYSYSELDTYTALPRGTIQAITAGNNPRLTLPKNREENS